MKRIIVSFVAMMALAGNANALVTFRNGEQPMPMT